MLALTFGIMVLGRMSQNAMGNENCHPSQRAVIFVRRLGYPVVPARLSKKIAATGKVMGAISRFGDADDRSEMLAICGETTILSGRRIGRTPTSEGVRQLVALTMAGLFDVDCRRWWKAVKRSARPRRIRISRDRKTERTFRSPRNDLANEGHRPPTATYFYNGLNQKLTGGRATQCD